MNAVHLQRPVTFTSDAHRLTACCVVGDVAVQDLRDGGPSVAKRSQKREKHAPALDEMEPVVLEVIDAPQLVGGDVLLRRGRLAGDAAPAELVRVLTIADQRDVPDRTKFLSASERGDGSVDHLPCRTGLRLNGNPARHHQCDRQHRGCSHDQHDLQGSHVVPLTPAKARC